MTASSDTSSFIASIPWLLAHNPEQAVVIITTRRGYIGATTVIDLPKDSGAAAAAVHTWAATIRADAATVVVVAADAAGVTSVPAHHSALIAALRGALSARGIELVSAYLVAQIVKGATWLAADDSGVQGVVVDPAMTAVAMHSIVSGRKVYPSRAALHEAVALTADQRAAEVAAFLEARLVVVDDECSDQTAQIAVKGVIEIGKRVSRGHAVDDDEYVFVATALTSQRVRDLLLALAITSKASHLERLWTLMAHDMPGPRRADVLALLAFFAYSRSDQPLAGAAVSAALSLRPEHALASTLDTALRDGRPPHKIWCLSEFAYAAAGLAEIRMPRRVLWSRRRAA